MKQIYRTSTKSETRYFAFNTKEGKYVGFYSEAYGDEFNGGFSTKAKLIDDLTELRSIFTSVDDLKYKLYKAGLMGFHQDLIQTVYRAVPYTVTTDVTETYEFHPIGGLVENDLGKIDVIEDGVKIGSQG